MKYTAVFILLGTFGLLIACKTQNSTKALDTNFTLAQQNDLKKIHSFFVDQICKGENKSFEKCFKVYYDFTNANGFDPLVAQIDFEKQREMYAALSKSTFDEIWNFGKFITSENGEKRIYKYMGFNVNGKYAGFLNDLATKDDFVKEYFESIRSAGDFEDIRFFQNRLKFSKNGIDFSDYNIQLLIAIHYLSENDHLKRRELYKD